jgi:hypothetical protein
MGTRAVGEQWDGVRLQGVVNGSAAGRHRRRCQARGRVFKLTPKARLLLRGPLVVNDCSPKCTCGNCVMRRLRKRGTFARGTRG